MASPNKRTHLPAFLLLLLRDTPAYGASLLGRLKSELPYFLTDSSNVYRTLQEMEEHNLVAVEWKKAEDGTPRKWYFISPAGQSELEFFYQDIQKRHANLEFFLNRYHSPTNNFEIKE